MGIRHFFRYVRVGHPGIVSAVSLDCLDHDVRFDRLFLDFNCAIHMCAERVGDSPLRHDGTRDGFAAAVIDATCSFLLRLVEAVRPRLLLYVAIDGVPPQAKMRQQRARRYLAGLRRDTPWDSNCVTPGTAFMRELSRRLRRTLDLLDGGVQIVFSDSDEEREGEQKIFRWLRTETPTFAPGERNAVYGMDADLMVLGCLSPAGGLYVLRPNDDIRTRFGRKPPDNDLACSLIDIDRLRSGVHARLGAPDPWASAREFAVLCSLLGNDFIPSVACLRIRDGAVDAIIDAYLARVGARERLVSADGRRINHDALADVLRSVADEEDVLMQGVDRAYLDACRTARERTWVRNDPDRYPLTTNPFPDRIRPREAGWRERYYEELFDGSGPVVDEACDDFLAGVTWSYLYHCQLPVSTAWSYPHRYAPTALDLVNHLASAGAFMASDLADRIAPRVTDPPMDVELQLLSVLPPSSADLLPPHLRSVMTDEDGCPDCYPTTFPIATYLKYYLGECVPVLPAVDTAHLAAIVRARSSAA